MPNPCVYTVHMHKNDYIRTLKILLSMSLCQSSVDYTEMRMFHRLADFRPFGGSLGCSRDSFKSVEKILGVYVCVIVFFGRF